MRRRGRPEGDDHGCRYAVDDATIAAVALGDEHGCLTPRFLGWLLGHPADAAAALLEDLVARGYAEEVLVVPPRFRQYRATERLRTLAMVRLS